MGAPRITVAIPTWNRQAFLAINLASLQAQCAQLPPGSVEVLVSDNASTDDTQAVVERAQAPGLGIRYIRNAENIGADRNFAQCFNQARGEYILMLGDDDILLDGVLAMLLERTAQARFGVICMRPYGYDEDWRAEYPGDGGHERHFTDPGEFVATAGQLVTFISSCLINKSVLGDLDAARFVGSYLLHVHLLLRAALAARRNLLISRYCVACKRNNSGGYPVIEVFTRNLGAVLDEYTAAGLDASAIKALERRMLLRFHPGLALGLRRSGTDRLDLARGLYEDRFARYALYRFWVRPILALPRPLALGWGLVTMTLGRLLTGDLQRGLAFAAARIRPRRHSLS
jgi:glycosyltransferase involved in cell wall biosynthesis